MLFKGVFSLKKHRIDGFLSIFWWFWCVDVKNRKRIWKKKFILIYFQVKSYFEKHLSPQSQIQTRFHLNCILLAWTLELLCCTCASMNPKGCAMQYEPDISCSTCAVWTWNLSRLNISNETTKDCASYFCLRKNCDHRSQGKSKISCSLSLTCMLIEFGSW